MFCQNKANCYQLGSKTAYLEAQKAADVALTVLQTLCLFGMS
jgi:hypothetical protein